MRRAAGGGSVADDVATPTTPVATYRMAITVMPPRAEQDGMLVYLHQYREADTKETVREGKEVVDQDPGEYFDKDELGPEGEWEQVSFGDRTIQRRGRSYKNVSSVSVPQDVEKPHEIPGVTIQLVIEGEQEFVEGAEIIDVKDEDP
jgi:hypothetical protein